MGSLASMKLASVVVTAVGWTEMSVTSVSSVFVGRWMGGCVGRSCRYGVCVRLALCGGREILLWVVGGVLP